jgi:hypothetical protein
MGALDSLGKYGLVCCGGAIVVIVLLVLVGAMAGPKYQPGNANSGSGSAPLTTASTGDNLQILNSQLVMGEYGTVEVDGTAQNVGSYKLSYGQVEVKFYDSSGTLLGNGLANFNDLDPGEKWAFKAMYMGQDSSQIASYKIATSSW